jgi:hypothetical protein
MKGPKGNKKLKAFFVGLPKLYTIDNTLLVVTAFEPQVVGAGAPSLEEPAPTIPQKKGGRNAKKKGKGAAKVPTAPPRTAPESLDETFEVEPIVVPPAVLEQLAVEQLPIVDNARVNQILRNRRDLQGMKESKFPGKAQSALFEALLRQRQRGILTTNLDKLYTEDDAQDERRAKFRDQCMTDESFGLINLARSVEVPTTALAKFIVGGEDFAAFSQGKECSDPKHTIIVANAKQREDRDSVSSSLFFAASRGNVDSNKKRGNKHEERISIVLNHLKIDAVAEEEQEGGAERRPDFLLKEPVTFGGEDIHWIEAKSGYLWPGQTPERQFAQTRQQLAALANEQGPGLVVWSHIGWHPDFAAEVTGLTEGKVRFARFKGPPTKSEERRITAHLKSVQQDDQAARERERTRQELEQRAKSKVRLDRNEKRQQAMEDRRRARLLEGTVEIPAEPLTPTTDRTRTPERTARVKLVLEAAAGKSETVLFLEPTDTLATLLAMSTLAPGTPVRVALPRAHTTAAPATVDDLDKSIGDLDLVSSSVTVCSVLERQAFSVPSSSSPHLDPLLARQPVPGIFGFGPPHMM